MNIALIAQAGVFGSLQRLARQWRTPRGPQRIQPAPSLTTSRLQSAPEFIAPHTNSTRASSQNTSILQPLRVIRVVEAGQARSSSGRMVISGRMADVCAELDRLVAREAALS
jgi:hypothetical protein